jgi:hypothetical protein
VHPDEYVYSSHRAYLGIAEAAWVSARAALATLDTEQDPTATFEQLVTHRPDARDIELFRSGGATTSRVIGGPEFQAGLPRHLRKYRSKISLEQIIGAVTQALGVEREHVMSSSRRRDLALARALIAWFAIERRVATLTDVARRLNRDPSTLSVAISRYSVSRRDLFRLNSLHYLTPLGPTEAHGAISHSEPSEAQHAAG